MYCVAQGRPSIAGRNRSKSQLVDLKVGSCRWGNEVLSMYSLERLGHFLLKTYETSI